MALDYERPCIGCEGLHCPPPLLKHVMPSLTGLSVSTHQIQTFHECPPVIVDSVVQFYNEISIDLGSCLLQWWKTAQAAGSQTCGLQAEAQMWIYCAVKGKKISVVSGSNISLIYPSINSYAYIDSFKAQTINKHALNPLLFGYRNGHSSHNLWAWKIRDSIGLLFFCCGCNVLFSLFWE